MKYIFSTTSYKYLMDEMLFLNKGLLKGLEERKLFSDGEKYLRIKTEVEDKHVIVIGGTESDSALLELYDLASTLVSLRCCTLTIIIPFYGYSTMERSVNKGESVGAKHRAKLLSSIPESLQGNKIFLMDLHSEGIPYYFEGNTHVRHIYCKPVIEQILRELSKDKEFVLGSADAGRSKWVESLANEFHDLNVTPAFVYKKRLSGSETKVTGINANVKQKHVIIYDDMIRTGSSLLGAAEAYLQAGAIDVSVVATHGVFPTGAVDKILNSGLIKTVSVTNTHPNSLIDPRVNVYSVASLINQFV